MKTCELCKSEAKVYCDSDQASLCWTCDTKVHSANFLVARHSRILLCRVCRSTTPWTAAGQNLGHSAVSICEKCVANDTSDDETEDEDEDEDEDENQVVPGEYTPQTPPPAASSSSSSSGSDDEESTGGSGGFLKRKRGDEDLFEDEVDCLLVKKNIQNQRADFKEANEGNVGILYDFLPLKSEAMGDKLKSKDYRKKISAEIESGTRTVGLDLNSSDL
ncbi:uncharacterized protein LOC143621319 [Bidens hawaiensis]|uniref:uncharacterized protein LOC143621319 n=1 Tax=Bidens hawaiensis TaxID=980011 RepID=UPI00404B5843